MGAQFHSADTNGDYITAMRREAVTGAGDREGGLVGVNNGTVTACFWDTETSGLSTSAGGTGLGTALMQTESTFTDTGWDFVSVWNMLPEGSYPHLLND